MRAHGWACGCFRIFTHDRDAAYCSCLRRVSPSKSQRPNYPMPRLLRRLLVVLFCASLAFPWSEPRYQISVHYMYRIYWSGNTGSLCGRIKRLRQGERLDARPVATRPYERPLAGGVTNLSRRALGSPHCYSSTSRARKARVTPPST